MPLPDLLEIVPLDKPVRAEITVPGSKSITNRALILAALADGEVTLEGALWSEDTQVMTEALRRLGFEIKVEPDPEEFCNRRITVKGLGGKIPNAGTPDKPLELFVGNAGTAARFLSAFVCLGSGVYRLSGVPRMHERPQAELFKALRQLGYRIDAANGKLPAVIHGEGPKRGKCYVMVKESSQFASALLLCSHRGLWDVELVGKEAELEQPHVDMTILFIKHFSEAGIEADSSGASYFLGAQWLLNRSGAELSMINVVNLPESWLQPDSKFAICLVDLELSRNTSVVPNDLVTLRRIDLGDSIMTAIVVAPFATRPVRATDLGRLRVQECERVVALRTELTKCGANVVEQGDTLTVYPSQLHGAEIETYNDHRMAMCFAILGLKVPGIKIKNPACVKKTFPNFFQKLASPPPKGLGATILDAKTGKKLEVDELFAD
jgi:3-phosphoshikimate 1-carboxyvinyltransferase